MIRLLIWFKPFSRYFFVAWILIILIVSSIPSVPTLKIHTATLEIRLDYLFHFGEYGILSFFALVSLADNKFKISIKKFISLTAGLISFAILDELHQKFIPGRSYNIIDMLSNILGILGALIICLIIFRIVSDRSLKA